MYAGDKPRGLVRIGHGNKKLIILLQEHVRKSDSYPYAVHVKSVTAAHDNGN